MLPNFRNDGLDPIRYNIVLLVTIDKFDPNLMFVNSNKLKPYRFIEKKNLQPVLDKLSDLVIDEPVQTKETISLPIEPKDFQHLGFELVSNHLTPGKIKTTNVLVSSLS